VTGQIERSIVTLLDVDCNSLQEQNLARSFTEYDELASNPKDISIPTVITDLE